MPKVICILTKKVLLQSFVIQQQKGPKKAEMLFEVAAGKGSYLSNAATQSGQKTCDSAFGDTQLTQHL